jgi:large subunit ribosomal protein L15
MPLQRRLPKFGFNNISRKEYKGINLDVLQALHEKKGVTTIDLDVLKAAGLIARHDLVKVLGKGELKAKLDVKVHAFSKSAIAAIEANQGTAVKIDAE